MKTKKTQPIGIFDSGIGGLGIFQKISHYLPNEDLVYFADNKNIPFGEKTVDELQKITENIFKFLIEKHNIKMAVIACNTASTICLSYLRKKFSIPIVGVVPVVKPMCEITKTKKVAILATPNTVNSFYLKDLIKQFAQGVKVFPVACSDLVFFVEQGEIDSKRVEEKLKEYLGFVAKEQIDVIGLGCTHFPFLYKKIKELLPKDIIILDSNDAVARQVVRVLSDNISNENFKSNYIIYATKDFDNFVNVAKKLLFDSNLQMLQSQVKWFFHK